MILLEIINPDGTVRSAHVIDHEELGLCPIGSLSTAPYTPLAILFHTTPASVSLTHPFVFHALQQATEEAKRMIETQCPIDEI